MTRPPTATEWRAAVADNKANWDARVPIHVESSYYDVEGWLASGRGPRPWEQEALGSVAGLRLAHLQCHIGLDTLAWARAGAEVVGVDFSAKAVEAATAVAARAGLSMRARFVVADVYRASEALHGERFDIVYVSVGSLCWLPDLSRWAGQAAALLRPGGRLYVHDEHPLRGVVAETDGRGDAERPAVVGSYFSDGPVWSGESAVTYTDGDQPVESPRHHVWGHTLGGVVTAVCDAGLRVRRLAEHDWTTWPAAPWLAEDPPGSGVWRAPAGQPRLPLTFTLLAHADRGHRGGRR